LAVEVISPHDRVRDLDRKVDDYFDAGVEEVWLIRPHVERVSVYRKDRSREFRMGSTLTSPEMLPGFALKLSDLFVRQFC
jgi:Uma2 family endonuclease